MKSVVALILSALAAGAQAIATGIATDEVKYIYNELKILIQQKWIEEPSAQELLSKYELDPESWKQVLAQKLEQIGVTQDQHIIHTAEELFREIDISGIFNRCSTALEEGVSARPNTSSSPSQPLTKLALENANRYFRFLNNRLGSKPIELEVESKGKKIRIDVSSRQELDAAIKAAQDFIGEGMPLGKILFDTPEQMKVGISERVSIRITKKLTYDFFEDLIHAQEVEVESIRVSQSMAASLRGDDFKIEAFGNEEQIVEDNDFTQWDWKVVPLKSGNRKLWASITIQVKLKNEQALKTLPVLEKEISVKINPVYSTTTFVTQYWQWLIASAIIPIAGLLLKK